MRPKYKKSDFWLYAEITLVLTPWHWKFNYHRNGKDVTLLVGPIRFTSIDG